MVASDLPLGIMMLLQISIGTSANIFLFLFYTRAVFASHKSSSSDVILAHLVLANTVILLASGIPETVSAWGPSNFLNDVGCKILIYLYRVARGLAICTTCLLSVFQAVTVSPGTSRWAGVKAKLNRGILPSCVLSWVLNMFIDFSTLLYMTGPQNSSRVRIILDLKYCSTVSVGAGITLLNAIGHSLWDLFFVGSMSVASGYMVFVLHRHHRRVRHLHGTGRSPGALPEVRAAKRVVTLVILYVLLYGRQTITLGVMINTKEKSPLLVNVHMVLSFTFSAVSPFLMIHSDRRIRRFWKRESPDSDTNPS
ncbi:vomeronasal 1 receptor ornAnaV1R3026 isoform X1 [Ornithorhynchus anatinus]|uniref:Vomeronasal type-1 receptor n=1 Tax=Ornithorhynchus anatinus TaxID=9258 RepID=A0A6I8NHQ2_ORNAN|nr:vomeronasal 1 receptor ornAnaV1R3026 [Ornithorhynchus anatinus]XP_028909418.1 vomeronasal 1 receptor ornAnaV1R3026 isoform X1 [Ornithorhynchus anatinus]